jgi:hypothetical protein
MCLPRTFCTASHHKQLPGVHAVTGSIAARLIRRIFAELPAQTSLLQCRPARCPFRFGLSITSFLDAYGALYNSGFELQSSARFVARALVGLFRPRGGSYYHIMLFTHSHESYFRLEVLHFLEQRVDQY